MFSQREDQGPGADVLRQNLGVVCQRVILPHQEAPGLFGGQTDVFVLVDVHRFQQKADVDQPLIQPVLDVVGHFVIKRKLNQRVFLGELADQLGKGPAAHGLGGPQGNQAADGIAFLGKALFQPVGQLHNFLRPLAEKQAVVGEGDSLLAPQNQSGPDFPFQIHHLAAEGRLGHMQKLCGAGDVSFAGCRQKIAQGAQLHSVHLVFHDN